MTTREDIQVVDVASKDRSNLDWILEEGFEGWYLMHSKRTLQHIELVRAAMESGKPVGLTMLKTLEVGSVGYVYYIAVAKSQRKRGIGKLLLEDALRIFKSYGTQEVYASVEKDNDPSEALFASEGFARTTFSDVSKKYGKLHAVSMYNSMRVVPGEILLRKVVTQL